MRTGPRVAAPGLRVIVTRPAAQAGPWVEALRAAGVDAVALPLIDIGPAPRPAEVDAAWRRLPGVALAFFVSANAVEAFFAHRPAGIAWPAATRAAAPGPGTARALHVAGVPPPSVVAPAEDAERFDSEQVWTLLRDEPWTGRSVLVVRGEDGRDWLADRWRAAGAAVDFVAAYARRAPAPDAAARRLLAEAEAAPQGHLWLFSSSEAVRQLAMLAPALPAQAVALATHPRIAQAARAAGFARVGTCEPRLAAVQRALRDLGRDGPAAPPDRPAGTAPLPTADGPASAPDA
jgi:uroporphyrinogen-III synthase